MSRGVRLYQASSAVTAGPTPAPDPSHQQGAGSRLGNGGADFDRTVDVTVGVLHVDIGNIRPERVEVQPCRLGADRGERRPPADRFGYPVAVGVKREPDVEPRGAGGDVADVLDHIDVAVGVDRYVV